MKIATIQQTITKKGLTVAQIKQWTMAMEKDPWEETRGILKPYKINALRYQKKMRKELERN